MASSGRVLPIGRSRPKPESGLPRPVITPNYFLSLSRPTLGNDMQEGVWRGGGATRGREHWAGPWCVPGPPIYGCWCEGRTGQGRNQEKDD
ncbi:hypothetical protein E2C01_097100 [Portunus trituberculatus]|uniref:Uncharacterized protein n=1 Tax=Portunus trituberculatus TaxID=210409 RepID=A0A5B7K3R0_PORTR|nr:hypothetical protein [Portunus trituberculatus]